MTVYELHNVKKCILHPDKNYVFIIEFNEFKLHFKAETSDEAKEWIKNIYEEIGALNTLKEIPMEKERPSNLSRSSNTKDATDPSTMDSVKTMKDRSLDKSSNGSPMTKMGKRASDKEKELSPEKMMRVMKSPLVKQEVGEDGCVRCSKGFFF